MDPSCLASHILPFPFREELALLHQSLSPMRSEETTHSIADDGDNGENKGVIIQTLTMSYAQLHNIPYVKA